MSMDEVCKEVRLCAHACALSVEVLVGVRIVRSHASVHVVLGVRLAVL